MRFASYVEIECRGRDGTGTTITPATTPTTIVVIFVACRVVLVGTTRCAATAVKVLDAAVPDATVQGLIAAVPAVVPVTVGEATARAMIAAAQTRAEAIVVDRTARVRIGAVRTAGPATAVIRMVRRLDRPRSDAKTASPQRRRPAAIWTRGIRPGRLRNAAPPRQASGFPRDLSRRPSC